MEVVNIKAKHAELVLALDKPFKRSDHKGYLLYLSSRTPGEIDGIYRSPMVRKQKKA